MVLNVSVYEYCENEGIIRSFYFRRFILHWDGWVGIFRPSDPVHAESPVSGRSGIIIKPAHNTGARYAVLKLYSPAPKNRQHCRFSGHSRSEYRRRPTIYWGNIITSAYARPHCPPVGLQ